MNIYDIPTFVAVTTVFIASVCLQKHYDFTKLQKCNSPPF